MTTEAQPPAPLPSIIEDLPPELRALVPLTPDGTVDVAAFGEALARFAREHDDAPGWFLIGAGRLARVGWTALREESAAVVAKWAPAPTQALPDDPLLTARDLLLDALGDQDAAFTRAIIEGRAQPLERVGLRHASRRVHLTELIAALEAARAEAQRCQQDAERRGIEREEHRKSARERVSAMPHTDDVQRTMRDVLAKLPPSGEYVMLSEIAPTKSEVVDAIIGLTHLAKEGRAVAVQRDVHGINGILLGTTRRHSGDGFPFAPIYVRRSVSEEES